MRTMRVKKRFYDLIYSGKKTLEVRVGYDSINRIQIGEHICLVTHTETFKVKISDIRRYSTFKEMLQIEPWKQIVPDLKSSDKALALLKQIYPAKKEKLGVVVLEFSQIESN